MNRLFVTLLTTFSVIASPSLTEQLNKKRSGPKKAPPEVRAVMTKALKELKDSKIEEKAVKEGRLAPMFKLDGKQFKSFYEKKPVILKLYRGAWCPYCQLELKDYQKYKEKIEKKGYQIIVVTPDSKKEIAKFKKKQGITIPIYQDKKNRIAKKFGIAFKLDKELIKVYKSFGIDLEKAQDNKLNELPMPGTYIIDETGRITYAFIDADYTKRLDPLDLLKKL